MSTFRRRLLEKLINFYPPLFGAGIRSRAIDERTIDVEMKLTFFNRNIVNVHFGGSLYALCDPWFMLILMRLLGKDYIVWDKAASIQFRRPGQMPAVNLDAEPGLWLVQFDVKGLCAEAQPNEGRPILLGVGQDQDAAFQSDIEIGALILNHMVYY